MANYITNTDVFLNVLKRRESIVVTDNDDASHSRIAYHQYTLPSSTRWVDLHDLSDVINTNLDGRDIVGYGIASGVAASLPEEMLEFTDVFVTDSLGVEIPVWYKHHLAPNKLPSTTISGLTEVIDGPYEVVGVRFLDSNQQTLVSDYLVSGTYIYHNLWPTAEKPIYLQYVVRNTVTSLSNTYVDLLDGINVYRHVPVTRWDVMGAYYYLEPQTYAMRLIIDGMSAETLEYLLPTDIQRFAYRQRKESNLEVMLPDQNDITQSLYPRVRFSVKKDSRTPLVIYGTGNYLPGVVVQDNIPTQRYLYRQYQVPGTIINEHLIACPERNITTLVYEPATYRAVQDTYTSAADGWYTDMSQPYHSFAVQVIVTDRTTRTQWKFATQTTDKLLLGGGLEWRGDVASSKTFPVGDPWGPSQTIQLDPNQYIVWSPKSRHGIASICSQTGLIYLEGFTLTSDMDVEIICTCKQDYQELTNIDLNPFTNPMIRNKTVAVFLTSFRADAAGYIPYGYMPRNTVFHVVVDENGMVLSSDSARLVEYSYIGTYPNYPFKTLLAYQDNTSTLPAEWVPYISNFQTLTFGGGVFPSPHPVIAELHVGGTISSEHYRTYDARLRGGGIKEDNYEDALALNQSVQYFWDKGNWDGMPYPGHATMLVEVPADLLKDCGGVLSQKQITDVVNRHVACGSYPVTRAYGVDITVSGIESRNGNLTLRWVGHGT